MSLLESLRTALDAVQTHRLRSVLTMLGILIGIAAVILTVGLGQGAQAQVRDRIDKLGSNLLIVSPGSTMSSTGVRGGQGSTSTLTAEDAAALGSPIVAPDVRGVAATSSSKQSLTAGPSNWTTSVIGTTPSWQQVRARTLSVGRFFDQVDSDQARSVVVLGPDTEAQLFPGRSAVGRSVTINGSSFTVVGVLDAVGSGSGAASQDDLAIVPQTSAALRVTGGSARSSVSTIFLQAESAGALTAAYQEADTLLLDRHGVAASSADFTITSQQSLLDTATATGRTLTVLLGGVAGISLLVSVTERVREIGLRKALGATPAVVRRQFLVEASLLGVTGGLLGLGLGLVGALVLPGVLHQPVTISPVAAVAAVAVALIIGVGAGVYPASRAARLPPIDALRNQ